MQICLKVGFSFFGSIYTVKRLQIHTSTEKSRKRAVFPSQLERTLPEWISNTISSLNTSFNTPGKFSFIHLVCVSHPRQPFKSSCFYSVGTYLGKNIDFWGAVDEATYARWVNKSFPGVLNDVFWALVVLEIHSANVRSSLLGKTLIFGFFGWDRDLDSFYSVYEAKKLKTEFWKYLHAIGIHIVLHSYYAP